MDEVEDRLTVHRHDKVPDDKEQPNPKKLAADWDAFVAEINLNEGKRDVLKELSDDRKWLLLKAHRRAVIVDNRETGAPLRRRIQTRVFTQRRPHSRHARVLRARFAGGTGH